MTKKMNNWVLITLPLIFAVTALESRAQDQSSVETITCRAIYSQFGVGNHIVVSRDFTLSPPNPWGTKGVEDSVALGGGYKVNFRLLRDNDGNGIGWGRVWLYSDIISSDDRLISTANMSGFLIRDSEFAGAHHRDAAIYSRLRRHFPNNYKMGDDNVIKFWGTENEKAEYGTVGPIQLPRGFMKEGEIPDLEFGCVLYKP